MRAAAFRRVGHVLITFVFYLLALISASCGPYLVPIFTKRGQGHFLIRTRLLNSPFQLGIGLGAIHKSLYSLSAITRAPPPFWPDGPFLPTQYRTIILGDFNLDQM